MRKSKPEFDAAFAAIAEPGIWLGWSDKRLSASKFGGLPWLPHADLWPRHHVTDLPLHFLCQIDLAALPSTPLPGSKLPAGLPRTGMLFFFCDMVYEMLWQDFGKDKQAATRVVHADAGAEPTPAPDDLPLLNHNPRDPEDADTDGTRLFVERWVEMRAMDFYPYRAHNLWDAGADADVRHVENVGTARGAPAPVAMSLEELKAMPQDEMQAVIEYHNMCPAIFFHKDDRHFARSGRRWEANFTSHVLVGPAIDVQGEARLARKEGRIALLQLASDKAMGRRFMFCDSGMAQFWIKPEDLASRRFDLAWATTEGG